MFCCRRGLSCVPFGRQLRTSIEHHESLAVEVYGGDAYPGNLTGAVDVAVEPASYAQRFYHCCDPLPAVYEGSRVPAKAACSAPRQPSAPTLEYSWHSLGRGQRGGRTGELSSMVYLLGGPVSVVNEGSRTGLNPGFQQVLPLGNPVQVKAWP